LLTGFIGAVFAFPFYRMKQDNFTDVDDEGNIREKVRRYD